jgi:hypothetical protein
VTRLHKTVCWRDWLVERRYMAMLSHRVTALAVSETPVRVAPRAGRVGGLLV